ncbi:histidinol dehydrogenase [Haliea sp. AH-315-K21]|uniref:Histidinol dehydrogenase n=1 Tax=SAR86 cluster bacterium TaxID=2030880 RepID=A0A2A5C9T6_9GAMM|nr:histidinol dehydrogenase [Haliea sp. AH-315-K21]PCJ40629.1 MAG: histidinol dehydrogenase [SAR86 cluster bacterium]
MTLNIRKLNAADSSFTIELKQALAWDALASPDVLATVASIIEAVKADGDTAVLKLTQKFDNRELSSAEELEIPLERLQKSLTSIPSEQLQALENAALRIKQYHEKQKQGSWQYTDADGSTYGQKVTALDRVGIYIPGGKASYPSTVLMDAIPAKVAGVAEVIAMVPTPNGEANELVLAALALAEVDRVFTVGGAQAIAALAYGTETIPAVDKIVGPGNIYVAMAKQQVFGQVGIDMVAGPSEILVICDGRTDPDWIAMDLFSQAEHDEDAQSVLVCPDAGFIQKVQDSMERLLPEMERKTIIRASLEARGLMIQVADLQQAAEVSNSIAPEHLELSIEKPEEFLSLIKHAGAIFLGRYTSEALGDYCAGPSHVLPTSGTARFSSALGVYDFQKRSSLINCSAAAAAELADTASILARSEGLTAHARSAEYRKSDNK